MGRVVLSGVVAQEIEGVAALREREPLGDQALQVDRLDLGAVLLGLGAALRLLVVVELARDPVGLAVEEVHEGPEEVGQVVLEPRATEQIGNGAFGDVRLGQGPRVGVVLEGPSVIVALEQATAAWVTGLSLCRIPQMGYKSLIRRRARLACPTV